MLLRLSGYFPVGLHRSARTRSNLYRFIHNWPATPKPTPYQIFGLDPTKAMIDKKNLQIIYFELVKTYHPDRSTTGDADRFKKIVEAHDILKDDSKRRSYDFTQQMSRTSQPHYYRQRHNRFDDDINVNYWSNKGQQTFNQGLYESRMWVLKLIMILVVVFTILNFLFLKKMSEVRVELSNAETERVAAQLAEARGWVGSVDANTPSGRIERFLKQRQMMLDRFDNEFSYGKLRSGMSRRESLDGGEESSAECENHDLQSQLDKAVVMRKLPPSNGVGQRQSKHNSGPVAEYFGRD